MNSRSSSSLLKKLVKTAPPTQVSTENASETIDKEQKEHLNDLSVKNKKEELKSKKETRRGQKQDRKQRLKFADKIFDLLSIYLFFILMLLFFSGFRIGGFYIANEVLIALLTTTTANIIGIFIFVPKYLYQRAENKTP